MSGKTAKAARKLAGVVYERRAVVIGIPAHTGVDPECIDSVEANAQDLKRRGLDVAILRSKGTYVHDGRNAIINEAYRSCSNFTHILFVDSDMSFGPSAAWGLLERHADIVGGAYVKKQYPFSPNAGLLNPDGVTYDTTGPDYSGKSGPVLDVDFVGTGLMLVARRVIARMDPPWFSFEKRPAAREEKLPSGHVKRFEVLGEDVAFCWKAQQLGFKVKLDLENQAVHLGRYGYTLADYLHADNQKMLDARLAQEKAITG